ncbi:DUF4266 domain-containing protein [Neptunicella sp.]|uniref:DUF4266 domain-containing protein n=1 Tax=Neptunicella sp. TaxID=2125986 RepID=UPI003F692600
MKNKLLRITFVVTLLQLSGCASLGVNPWERDLLAKDEMMLDADSIDVGLDEHIYFSKEATSGGRAFGGGGCGCN